MREIFSYAVVAAKVKVRHYLLDILRLYILL